MNCPKCNSANVATVAGVLKCSDCGEYSESGELREMETYLGRKKRNRIKWQIVIVAGGIILAAWIYHARQQSMLNAMVGVNMATEFDSLSYDQKVQVYRTQTESAVLETCTNYVVGFRRATHVFVFSSDDNYKKWTASADVEFFNKVGGVEKKTIEFRFDTYGGGHISALQNDPR
jgi:hypothetical protein